jgi:hypothetical protein
MTIRDRGRHWVPENQTGHATVRTPAKGGLKTNDVVLGSTFHPDHSRSNTTVGVSAKADLKSRLAVPRRTLSTNAVASGAVPTGHVDTATAARRAARYLKSHTAVPGAHFFVKAQIRSPFRGVIST